MSVHVLSFDPLQTTEVTRFEHDLDTYLSDGWDIISTIAGNRQGIDENMRAFRSNLTAPNYKDYVVFVLRKIDVPQPVPN